MGLTSPPPPPPHTHTHTPRPPKHARDPPPPPLALRLLPHSHPQDNTGFNASTASCEISGGGVSASFTRAVANGAYSISMNSTTSLAWAVGYDFATFTAGHELQGVAAVDMKTGASSALGRKPMHLAHGSLNFLAWGVLLPLGVLMARFTKGVPVKAVSLRVCA